MGRFLGFALAAFLVLLCAPRAAATVDQASQYLFEASHRLTYKNTLAAMDDDEARLRGTADADESGDVSAPEAEAFLSSLRETALNLTSGPFAGLTLDDRPVATIAIENLTHDALTGPVAGRGGLILDMRATVTFELLADDGPLYFRAVVPDAELEPRNLSIATIAAPPGFAILSHNGLAGAQLSAGERTVNGKKSAASFSVEFGEPATEATPGAPAILTLVALAIVAVQTWPRRFARPIQHPFRNA